MSKVTFKTNILPNLEVMKQLGVLIARPEINMEIKVSKNKRIVYKANIKLNCKYSTGDYEVEECKLTSEYKLDDDNKKFVIDTLKTYEEKFNKKLEDTILKNQAGLFTEKITENL
jgi:hypothetical protein